MTVSFLYLNTILHSYGDEQCRERTFDYFLRKHLPFFAKLVTTSTSIPYLRVREIVGVLNSFVLVSAFSLLKLKFGKLSLKSGIFST